MKRQAMHRRISLNNVAVTLRTPVRIEHDRSIEPDRLQLDHAGDRERADFRKPISMLEQAYSAAFWFTTHRYLIPLQCQLAREHIELNESGFERFELR